MTLSEFDRRFFSGYGCSVGIALGLIMLAAFLLAGCDRGPTEADMAGCTVRSGGPRISAREVADCAVDKDSKQRFRTGQ